MNRPAGIVLAAGRGRRFGRPKALVRLDGEPLVARAVRVLRDGGCAPVFPVLGAEADRIRPLVPAGASTVVAEDWATGISASLSAGLRAAALDPDPSGALIHLVDLPDIGPDVIRRIRAGSAAGTPPDRAVIRAVFGGRPGHPVLLGRAHWASLLSSVHGDTGAGPWLRGRDDLLPVECGDLATGADADTPDALRRHGRVT